MVFTKNTTFPVEHQIERHHPMETGLYEISKTAELRIAIISKFGWRRCSISERWFTGFNLINFHSYNSAIEEKDRVAEHSFGKVKFNYLVEGERLKMGQPHLLVENTKEYNLTKYNMAREKQDVLFLGYSKGDDRPIASVVISKYLLSIIADDCNMGKKIQLFDISLDSDNQMYDCFSISNKTLKHFDKYIPQEITFSNSEQSLCMFSGRMINHKSVSIEEYIKLTGFDYVLNEAKKTYYGEHSEYIQKKYSLEEFVERMREIYNQPFLFFRHDI